MSIFDRDLSMMDKRFRFYDLPVLEIYFVKYRLPGFRENGRCSKKYKQKPHVPSVLTGCCLIGEVSHICGKFDSLASIMLNSDSVRLAQEHIAFAPFKSRPVRKGATA